VSSFSDFNKLVSDAAFISFLFTFIPIIVTRSVTSRMTFLSQAGIFSGYFRYPCTQK
jgi:hypothetical protein